MDDFELFGTRPWDAFKQSIINIIISENITSIGNASFVEMNNLKKVILPEELDSIGTYAFIWNKSLEEMTIPAKEIGQLAIYSCDNLKRVILTDNVEEIQYAAFCGCVGIENLSNPASVNNVWNNAFIYMKGLRFITVNESNPNYSNDENGILYNKDKTKLIAMPELANWTNNETNLKYIDLSGNNYFIFDNCIYDFKVSDSEP